MLLEYGMALWKPGTHRIAATKIMNRPGYSLEEASHRLLKTISLTQPMGSHGFAGLELAQCSRFLCRQSDRSHADLFLVHDEISPETCVAKFAKSVFL